MLEQKKVNEKQWIVGTGFSRGIGFALMQALKEVGFKILHLGRHKTGEEHDFLWWDLCNPIHDNPLKELTRSLYGKSLVGFYYGAGIVPLMHVHESDVNKKKLFWQSQNEAMRVNYFSCAELFEEILPFLLAAAEERGNGDIPFAVYMSSLAAVDPFPGLELYGGTKSAALCYFKWLSRRFSKDQLQCLSLSPGLVKTDMVLDILKQQSEGSPLLTAMTQAIDDNKMLTPGFIAEKIVHFLVTQKEKKSEAHGKLYLVDEGRCYL